MSPIGRKQNCLVQILCSAVFVLWALPAGAASFNCSKAQSNIEHMICGSPTLSQLDDELAALYREALSKVSDPADLRVIQRSWITNSRDRCKDSQCVESAYRIKLVDLQSRIPAPGQAAAAHVSKGNTEPIKPNLTDVSSSIPIDPRSSPQNKERQDPTILIWIAIALFGAGGAIMPKRDRRFKTGYRNFSWARVFVAGGLYACGLAIFAFIFLGK